MKDRRNIFLFLVNSAILIFFLTGCTPPQNSTETTILSGLAGGSVPAGDEMVAKRFQESAPQNPTAIESAIELSKRYAKLSEEVVVLRQKNRNLLNENQQLKNKLGNYSAQLGQTQKELTEANDLLINMRIELNNWKNDILGFRGEIRQADTEQLRALIKILEILGGELKIEPAESEENPQVSKTNAADNEDTDSIIVSMNKAEQLKLKAQETSTLGD